MRLPNGYGSVYKLSGKRRKPYVARKTTGWEIVNGKKRQIYSIIGYYENSEKALQALSAYNGNPYDLSLARTTFSEIYELWKKDEFDEDSKQSTVRGYTSAYKHCHSLYNERFADITVNQLQRVLDEHSDMSYERVNKIRTLFSKMYQWAIKQEFIGKNRADGLAINVKQGSKPKQAFSTEEIQALWSISDDNSAKIALILIYCGVRINELLSLKKEDIDFKEQIFYVRKSKTKSGIRVVPIANKVLPFWNEFYERSKIDYVFTNPKGGALTYENFKKHYWYSLMARLNFNHTIHETRHTCISQLTMQNANPTIIKIIVGHKSVMSLTEKTYTHISNKELLKTINLIP